MPKFGIAACCNFELNGTKLKSVIVVGLKRTPSVLTMVTEILLFVVTFLLLRFLSQCWRAEDGTGRRKNPPPCPRGFPLLGNMSVFLGCREPIYTVLQKLSEEHGDILGLTVCGKKFVVLGSSEAIREAFVRHAVDFAGRPYMFSVSLLTRKNCGIAFSDYSPAWMEHRKSATSALRLSLKQGPSTTRYFALSLKSFKKQLQ